MSTVEVKKIKTEWRAVEFDGSEGSESYEDIRELLDWSGCVGVYNYAHVEYGNPHICISSKKPNSYDKYLNHGDWIVASSRGKVKVLTADEFNDKFKEK